MPLHLVYLHGFGSTAKSAKAAALQAQLGAEVASLSVPELDGGDFPGLTMELYRQRAVDAVAAVPDDGLPLILAGSSLGGYTAALIAAEGRVPRADALLLIAPAFGFTESWAGLLGEAGIARWRRDGSMPFFHYGEERELPLGRAFLDSCEVLPAIPAPAALPTTIVHGRRDESVDPAYVLRYAEQDPAIEVHLLDDGHSLTSPPAERLIAWCARELARSATQADTEIAEGAEVTEHS